MKLHTLVKNITNRLNRVGKKALALGVVAVVCAEMWGTDYTLTDSGDWNDYNKWNSGFAGWFQYPQAGGDNAKIPVNNASISVNTDITVGNIEITGTPVTIGVTDGKTLSSSQISLASGKTLTISTNTSGKVTAPITGSGTINITGSGDLSGINLSRFSGTVDLTNYAGNISSLNIPAGLAVNYPSIRWIGGTSDWNTGSNWNIGRAPSSTDDITIDSVTAPNEYPIIDSASDISVNSITFLNDGKLTINGKLTLPGDYDLTSKIVTTSSGTLVTTGKITTSTGYDSSTLNIECDSIELNSSDKNIACNKLTANTTTLSKRVTLKTSGNSSLGLVTCSGKQSIKIESGTSTSITDLTISASDNGENITLEGSVNITGTVQINGTNSINLKNNTPSTLTIPTLNLANDSKLNITGNISAGTISNAGTLTVGANTLTNTTSYSGTGTISVSGGTLDFSSAVTPATVESLEVSTSATLKGGSTALTVLNATYNSSPSITTEGNVTLPGGTLGTLTVSSGSTTTLSAALSAATITNAGTLTVGANTLTNTSAYSGAGSISVSSGTLDFSSVASATVESLEVSTSATLKGGSTALTVLNATYNSSPSITTEEKVTLPGGTLGTLTVSSGSTTLAGATTTTSTIANGTLTANNALTTGSISIGSSGNITGSNNPINVGGNWSNSHGADGYTANGGSVVFTSSATISGNTTFNSLSCSTGDSVLSFAAGSKQTASSFTIAGSKSNPITLQSTATGSQWEITTTNASVTGAKVKDSKATNPSITATNSLSLGNNINWIIPGTYKWTNTATSTTWTDPRNWVVLQLDDSTYAAAVTYPQYSDDIVTIENSSTAVPHLSNDTTLSSLTINSSTEIDLENKKLTASTVTNNGTVKITLGGSAHSITTLSENGTVIYTDTGTSLPWGTQYNNIKFDSGASVTNSENLTINGTTTIAPGNGNTISLTGDNTFTGDVTINSGAVTLKGQSAGFNIASGATADSLEVQSKVNLKGNVTTTTGTQSYQEVILNNDSELTATKVTFNSTVDGAYTLTITGQAEFKNVVGGTTQLTSLSVSQAATINTTAISTSTTQTYSGAVTLSSDTTLTASKVTFASTVDGAKTLAITGKAEFKNIVGGTTQPTSLSVSQAATINTTAISTSTTQTYSGPVTLSSDTTLTASKVTFDSTVDGAHTLAITGQAEFKDQVGNTNKPTSLSVSQTATINTTAISTSTTQTYSGPVTLSSDTTLSASKVTFASTVDGTHTLTITGQAEFVGVVGGTNKPTSLSVSSDTTINTSAISTSDTQTYSGPVTLSSDTTLSASKVTFASSVDGAHTLTIKGQAEFKDQVGNTNKPTSLSVSQAATINTTAISTSDTQTYSGAVTLSSDTTLTASKVTFASTVDGTHTLTITGQAEFKNQVGNTNKPTSLSVSSDTTINTTAISTSDTQTYSGAVTLSSDTTLTASKVTFASTVDGTQTLAITGQAEFKNVVGNTNPPTSLSVSSSTSVQTTSIKTSGNQTYTGETTVAAQDTAFEANAGSLIAFSNKLTGTNKSLSITTANAEFDKEVSGFTTISVDGTSLIKNNITSTDNQTYLGAVTLDGSSTFTSAANKLIHFKNTITGSKTAADATPPNTPKDSLTISTANVQFDGNISDIVNLTAQEKATINTSNITTTGDQTYSDELTITAATQLSAKNISTQVITSSKNATFTTSEKLNFNNDVTFTAADLTITNTGIFTSAEDKSISCTTLTQNGSGKNMLGGNISTTTSTFTTDLYIFGAGNTSITGTFTSNGNIIIAKNTSSQTITINSTLLANNIVLYSGDVTANENITSTNDTVLLGASYNVDDSVSIVSDAYIYEQTRFGGSGTGAANNYTLEDKFPDQTNIPPKAGKLTISSTKTLSVGKNFYANGITLSGDIALNDNTDSTQRFAEAYNCNVSNSTVTAISGTAQIACEDCTLTSTTGWNQDPLFITQAYTVRDNTVYIEFNRPIRNKHEEVNTTLAHANNYLKLSNGIKYSAAYKDADCQTSLGTDEVTSFYIKAEDSWNTDATGSSIGSATSTDRNGIQKTNTPFINLLRNSSDHHWLFTDIYGKRIDNYNASTAYGCSTDTSHGAYDTATHKVEDHTGPVLYSVRTGQEQHTPYNNATGAASQPGYDAHNFIEFRYSEPVNFGDSTGHTATDTTNIFDNSNLASPVWLPANATPSDTTNVCVRDSLGALSDLTATSNLTLAGLGCISSGKIYTGSNGTPDKYVNSIYRIDPYTIRLSIAGYTEGTTTDRDGNTYKNWKGYIESATQPSGTVTMAVAINPMVTDCAVQADGTTPLFNSQEQYAANRTEPSVNSTATGIYGNWDLNPPVFAPLRLKSDEEWSKSAPGQAEYYEAVGNTSGSGSTLQKIEFHFFDNTPNFSAQSYSDPAWLTEKGWVHANKDNSKELYEDYTYCADIFGGSRQFDNDPSIRTTGGLRFSTISHVNTAFKYVASQTSGSVPNTPFSDAANAIYPGAKAPLFTGSSSTRRAADDPDGLYFGIQLPDTSMPLDQSFTISYDESTGFITDLAGNRLRSATIKSIDRTPPSYDFILAPINQNELYMVFVKELAITSDELNYKDTNGVKMPINETFESLIPKCFQIFKMDSEGAYIASEDLHIDTSIPAKIETVESKVNHQIFTTIRIRLNRNITLKDIEETYLRVNLPEGYTTSQDPVTGLNDSKVTFIQDRIGNYMPIFTAHSLSDFAISSIKPLYAYDQDMEYNGVSIMDGLYEEGSWAVHDWNEAQQNYGTLPANHPYGLVADIDDGTESFTCKTAGAKLFLAINPSAEAVSKQINSDLNIDLRIWFPELPNSELHFMALENIDPKQYSTVDSTLLDESAAKDRLHFDISKEITDLWGANKQVTFLFGLTDEKHELIRIYNTPYYDVANNKYNLRLSTAVPLFALRLTNPEEITSIDLWSFKTKSIIEQRGGVTILNNVINATNGEKVALKVNMPSEGKLNVSVMTLDGNIITYLNHGTTSAGEHYYSWNGRNKHGTPVARGMYFIRVVGNGIDETRKVMVVK